MSKGIRILLSIPAGNAALERWFGKLRSLLSPWRKTNQLVPAYLNINAPQLAMDGYRHLSKGDVLGDDSNAWCDLPGPNEQVSSDEELG